jgi:hypothetical protein
VTGWLAIAALCGCSVADAQSAQISCLTVCSRMVRLRCEEAAWGNAETCGDVCINFGPVVPKCVAMALSCEEARECRQ